MGKVFLLAVPGGPVPKPSESYPYVGITYLSSTLVRLSISVITSAISNFNLCQKKEAQYINLH